MKLTEKDRKAIMKQLAMTQKEKKDFAKWIMGSGKKSGKR